MRAATNHTATAPSGTLTKNTQCQPKPSVRKPPTSGPTTLATPNTAPTSPVYLPRTAGGKMSAITAKALVNSPAAPSPCTARAAMSAGVEGLTPHSTDPVRKMPMAVSSTGRRP
jgi:hypothetical protein